MTFLRGLLLLLSSSLSSPLCSVFTITYLQQNTLLRYTMLQLFCIYSLCYIQCYFAPEICFVLYISTSRSTYAVPNMAVVCSTLISCHPGVLLRYCVSDFVTVPVARNITLAFTVHTRSISVIRSAYLNSSQLLFLVAFCPVIAPSIDMRVLVYYHGLWCPV